MQTTDHVLMVRPVRFAFNEETAANNAFQQRSDTESEAQAIQQQAVLEFDAYVKLLRENGVTVEVLQDTPTPFTPDSIFPNNCFSTHLINGERVLVIYPMFAPNRRRERPKLCRLLDRQGFARVIDLTTMEGSQHFLEGTGSMVLDRDHRMAYACISPRTSEEAIREWAELTGYDYLLFNSEDAHGTPIYHTNVMMHVGSRFAVVCMASIRNAGERECLRRQLEGDGKEILEITLDQMCHFAGNMLELRSSEGNKLLVMSATAQESLRAEQIQLLKTDVQILSPDIHTIETAGGGSARCMIAELF